MSLASSFPEKYSLPDVAKQVAARKALDLLKKNNSCINIPVTEDNDVIVERLEKVRFELTLVIVLICFISRVNVCVYIIGATKKLCWTFL